MASLDFVVKKVYPGTQNQRNAGIHATFGIDIVVDEVVVASLADYKLCKTRDGEPYIQSPYREYERKGDQSGSKQKIYFAKLFPNERDSTHVKAIVEQVKRACEQGPPRGEQNSGGYKKYNNNNSGQRSAYQNNAKKYNNMPSEQSSNNHDW